jgi:hypothetical protein
VIVAIGLHHTAAQTLAEKLTELLHPNS